MEKKVLSLYKLPLVISFVIALTLCAVGNARLPIEITQIALGAILGTFVLDLEFFIYAFVLEPTRDFSKTVAGYLKHRDIPSAFHYIYYHRDEVEDKSLNSSLFQIVIAAVSIFVVTATTSPFARAFVLSIFANSIYKLFEYYYLGKTDEWFWAIKQKPTKGGVRLYLLCMIAVLGFCVFIF